MANYLFTSESVTEGHPDKLCDQISDAVLDAYLAADPHARVACECFTQTGMVMVMGEITANAQVDIPSVARGVIRDIGYTSSEMGFDADTCAVFTSIDRQSPDIAQGVTQSAEGYDAIGAGDQGMMFGFACDETANLMPLALDLSHALLRELAAIRKEGSTMTYLRPDAKSQVTVEYSAEGRPVRIHTIVISTQHDEFIQPAPGISAEEADKLMLQQIRHDVATILIPRVVAQLPADIQAMFDDSLILHVNPTGKFVIGGPHGDTGLTGRKIVVDTYGGRGAHGGGAFSGKDPSKVDRSAAYAARHIAKNLVAAGVAREALVQVAYAIGVAQPVSLYVNTRGTARVAMTDGEISARVARMFDMTPYGIEQRLKLRNPIYRETAAYGHMGQQPCAVTKTFGSGNNRFSRTVELFTWERLDRVDDIRKEFGLN